MIRKLLLNRENWDSVAVIEDGQSHSYRQLAGKALAIQKLLIRNAGENVAIFLPNGRDYISALFGTFMSGAVAFPINSQLTSHEIIPLLAQASVHTVITSAAFAALFEEVSTNFVNPIKIVHIEKVSIRDIISPVEAISSSDEPMILLSTSGTTSSAKLVQLSEKNVETSVTGFLTYIDYGAFDKSKIRYLLAAPFASVYGLLILSVCLANSFPLVIPKGTFNLDTLYRNAQDYGVTHYEGGTAIPILMDQMSGRPIPYDISSLKFIGFGGSKISADMLTRLAEAYPDFEFCQGYGMTESASLIARHIGKMLPEKFDAVGTAIPKVTIGVEVDGNITTAPFATGEVVARGPNVMLGYYKNEAETNKTVKNGCLYTGDIGYLDEDGFLHICGRKKNVIMVRGFSVYAEEVEECLLSSGLVKDCTVYGAADPRGNEIVCADVVPASTETDIDVLRLYCAKHLAGYKQPQRIQTVETIKKTVTGKSERTANAVN